MTVIGLLDLFIAGHSLLLGIYEGALQFFPHRGLKNSYNVMVPMFSLIVSGMSFQILGKVAMGSSSSFLLSPLWGMKMFLLRFRSRAKVKCCFSIRGPMSFLLLYRTVATLSLYSSSYFSWLLYKISHWCGYFSFYCTRCILVPIS